MKWFVMNVCTNTSFFINIVSVLVARGPSVSRRDERDVTSVLGWEKAAQDLHISQKDGERLYASVQTARQVI